jgi:peptide/nickel transport system substrate-binding protein
MKKLFLLLWVFALVGVIGIPQAMAERYGGTFHFVAPYGSSVSSLDAHRTTRTQDAIVCMSVHRALYNWDAEQSKPVLELAESVAVSPDQKVYTYKLLKNAKFHNGRTMTADDIIWSYNRIMSPKIASPAARYVRNIQGAVAVEKGDAQSISGLKKLDDYTLEMTLETPGDPAYFLFRTMTAILPKEVVEAKGDGFATSPVGLGPFKFVKWVRGSEIIMEKFPDWYKKGRPYLDKVVYKIMGEGAARDLAFRSKEVDAINLGSAQYQVYAKDPELSKNLLTVAEMYTRHVGFNLRLDKFKDKRIRQAFNHAINKDLIIEKYVKGKAFAAKGWLPSSSPAFNKEAKGYEYDPEKAKQLLKEAGLADGISFELVTTDSKSYGIGIIEACMPFLANVGIELKPKLVESAVNQELVYVKQDFESYVMSFNSGPDPLTTMKQWHSKNPAHAGNYIGYNNPEYDAVIDAAEKETDPAKRIELLKKADGIFMADAPMWFFNYNKAVIAYQPWVHGMQSNPVEAMFQDMDEIWVEESSPRAKLK